MTLYLNLKCVRLSLIFLIIIAAISGCKNHPPYVTHNWDSDTIIVDHGKVVNIDLRFIDDRKELKSVRVGFNGAEKYSGADTSYMLEVMTGEMAAGRYMIDVTASDEDDLLTESLIVLQINAVKPVIGNLSISNVRATGARIDFSINSNGGLSLEEKGLLFSPEGEPGMSSEKIVVEGDDLSVSGVIDGFPRNRNLMVKAYATNGKGTTLSNTVGIKTMTGIPAIVTGGINDIHSKAVMASGNLTTDGGANIIMYGICFSENPEPTIKERIARARSGRSYNIQLDGLTQFTKYYYRAFAVNRFVTVYGEVKEFETTGPPTTVTGDPGRIMVASLFMNMEVTDNGGHNVTEAGITYSMLHNPTIDSNTFVLGNGTGKFSGNVENLDAGTQYYLRAYAVNSEGVGYGDEIVLLTKKGIPEVHTAGIRDLDYSAVTVVGDIPDDGGLDIIERGVVWDTVTNPTKINNYAEVPGTDGTFSFTINGLKSGITYYTRAYARNERGYVYADPVRFVPYLKTDMAQVDGSTFRMGSEKGDKTEKLVHEVTLSTYQIGKFEVTNEEFAKFLNYFKDEIKIQGNGDIVSLNGYPVYNLKVYGEDYEKTGFKVHISYTDGEFRVNEECAKFPAILITWKGARMFCEWAGGRLPTEAEWEFAARGGRNSTNDYSGGDNIDPLGWYFRNCRDALCPLMPDGRGLNYTGLKRPNNLDIYDMTGNVSEWCNDIYSDNYYEESADENPIGPAKGLYRVIRGGSWADREDNCTVYRRIKSFDIDRGYDNIGFRLVRPVEMLPDL
ncbi:MAG TPA: SUMF1/EgtB/PvdO family nonheme iron enzyme [Bacteroidales bacterium]|nr:SUMF1/EgtB/PvdO family nonheme iron enzyme [Bacteroidales bacterium]